MAQVEEEERNTNSTLTLEDLDSFGNLNLQTGFDFDKEVLNNIREIDQLYNENMNHDYDMDIVAHDLESQLDLQNEDLDQLDLDQLDLHDQNRYDEIFTNGLDHLGLDQIQDPLNQSEIDQLEGMTKLTMPIGSDSLLLQHRYESEGNEIHEENGAFFNADPEEHNIAIDEAPVPSNSSNIKNLDDQNQIYKISGESGHLHNVNSLQDQIKSLQTQLLHSERDKQVQILQLRKDLLGEKERVLLDFTKQVKDHQNNLEFELKEARETISRLQRDNLDLKTHSSEIETERSRALDEINSLNSKIETLRSSNERLTGKLESQMQHPPPTPGFPFEELNNLLEPVITIPSPLSIDSLKQGIIMLVEHVQSQSDRLKNYIELESHWDSEKKVLERENEGLVAKIEKEIKISRSGMVSQAENLKTHFNKVYQKSLQDFKQACIEKHKAVVFDLKNRIKQLESQNLRNQANLKQKYLLSLKKMQSELQRYRIGKDAIGTTAVGLQ